MSASEFFKMSAAGNDFILFDNGSGEWPAAEMRDRVRRLCTRALSVGADGLILLETSRKADIRARFFNPDGEATFCGNGARCAARLAYLQGLAPARLVLETDRGLHRAEVTGDSVIIDMPDPEGFTRMEVEALGRTWRGARLDTGVPHFVALEEGPHPGGILQAGRALRSHPSFGPAGVNVDFVHPNAEGDFSIRTFERGVENETLACGTGTVAAALALSAAGKARSPVVLRAACGAALIVRFEGDPMRATGIRLQGEARLVYVGHLSDEALSGFAPPG
jgi:diaminopimelate epimerase